MSWKSRLSNTIDTRVNKEEEIELTINSNEFDNLIYILENVIHMSQVKNYERYRTTFINDEVEMVLDEYPFGLALELEAKTEENVEKIIDKYIKLLNLDYKNSYRLS